MQGSRADVTNDCRIIVEHATSNPELYILCGTKRERRRPPLCNFGVIMQPLRGHAGTFRKPIRPRYVSDLAHDIALEDSKSHPMRVDCQSIDEVLGLDQYTIEKQCMPRRQP